MRVHVVDPSAYTPPYDHALCRALAAAGADVRLYTSHFAYDELPPPAGYRRVELFYPGARLVRGRSKIAQHVRRTIKISEHIPDMLRYRRAARDAEIVHFQWLTVPQLDGRLLPSKHGRRLVLTAHDVLAREPGPGQRAAQRRLFDCFDAVVVHSRHGRERLVGELGVDPGRVHEIAHGAFAHLADIAPAPASLRQTDRPVVLFFGLLRPYKGIDVLLEAWRGIEDAELWIVGMPRMDVSALRAAAPPSVHFVERFVSDGELAAYFSRADLVVLPYREIEQSGVLFTALAFGKPVLVSDVGGFGELAAAGAVRAVTPGDPQALHDAIAELLGDRQAMAALAQRARSAAAGEYAWEAIADRTLALYRSLLGENPRP